ncbi:MAG TPA: STAS domain-containing protein [Anaeromyxobacteraceae bacterium]|nr:STAS domain-containing protein [Anaeromyxobacteraceae bacterium]
MDGVFDVTAAQVVVRALEKAPTERLVRIDLTHVREFHDFAVAVLAQSLAKRRENVSVCGLRQHQLRLLNYLGLGQTAEPLDMTDSAMA